MRRLSVGFVAAAATALMLAGAPSASAQEQLAASCEPPPESTLGNSSGVVRIAQTFTAQLSGQLTRAEIAIRKLAGTSGDWIVAIRTVDGSGAPTETVLASVTISDATVPTGDSILAAVFPAPANVIAGETYAISITREGTDSFFLGHRDDCPGSVWSSVSGAAWQEAPGLDLVFRVFVVPTVPIPPVNATCKGEQATQVGSEGNDEVTGTPGRDVIAGLGGRDEIRGLSGKDLICGGKGKDTLRGGKGKDKLYGQKGKDKLVGGGGKDRCVGGKKDDSAKKCEVEKSI